GSGALVLTGQVSLAEQPWLGDHAVAGTVLLPGTAFVDLALHAADLSDYGEVGELTLEAPLVLAAGSACDLQVTVEPPEAGGNRQVAIYSRQGKEPWIRNALCTLNAEASPMVADATAAAWPPAGAVALDIDGCYDQLAAAGYEYGP